MQTVKHPERHKRAHNDHGQQWGNYKIYIWAHISRKQWKKKTVFFFNKKKEIKTKELTHAHNKAEVCVCKSRKWRHQSKWRWWRHTITTKRHILISFLINNCTFLNIYVTWKRKFVIPFQTGVMKAALGRTERGKAWGVACTK